MSRVLVSMPRCWQWLVTVEFEQVGGVPHWTDGQGRTLRVEPGAAPVAHPDPRALDERVIEVPLPDGTVVQFLLRSNLGGYWGEIVLDSSHMIDEWAEVIDLGGYTFILLWRD